MKDDTTCRPSLVVIVDYFDSIYLYFRDNFATMTKEEKGDSGVSCSTLYQPFVYYLPHRRNSSGDEYISNCRFHRLGIYIHPIDMNFLTRAK